MKARVRFVRKKLKSLEDKLDNGIVKNGQVMAPEYAWSVQRKFGLFGIWSHWMWQKQYPVHLEFLQQDLDTRGISNGQRNKTSKKLAKVAKRNKRTFRNGRYEV